MAGADLPLITVRKQIASAIHIIVQATRLRDGSRKVTSITEILGMEGETVIQQELYKFFDEGDDENGKLVGYHGPTGIRPSCNDVLQRAGFELPPSMFMKKGNPLQGI
jgi:pilus assembly protein CpaF